MPLKESEINGPALEEVADELLRAVNASRVTVRLDVPDIHPYYPVFGEAIVPGVKSFRDVTHTHTEMRNAPTYKHIMKERKMLVQDDVTISKPVSPALLEYGIAAEVLAPIFDGEAIEGMLSVHHSVAPHPWSEADLQAIRDAAVRVHRALGFEVPSIYA